MNAMTENHYLVPLELFLDLIIFKLIINLKIKNYIMIKLNLFIKILIY
jgi:hypothetical protein